MCEYALGIKKSTEWNGPFPTQRDVVLSSGQIKREREREREGQSSPDDCCC